MKLRNLFPKDEGAAFLKGLLELDQMQCNLEYLVGDKRPHEIPPQLEGTLREHVGQMDRLCHALGGMLSLLNLPSQDEVRQALTLWEIQRSQKA